MPVRSFRKIAFVLVLLALTPTAIDCAPFEIIAPPQSFFELVREKDRSTAQSFYRKFLDIEGLPVVSSAEVADEALLRTHDIVSHMLAGRPDIHRAMAGNGMYLIIIGKDQVYADMPEYRDHPNPEFQNERVRGTGGKPTSFGEENLLSLPIDRYDDESIAVHEFCHTIDSTLRSIDPSWPERRNTAFRNAMEKSLWKNTYAASNPGEFWAEIAQAYFDCNRVNNWNHGPIGTREQLRDYDPASYELVRTTFNLSPGQDWRYRYAQSLPNIITPPERFAIDPYYTKFTYAREFPVIGRDASDEALLAANDIIRKMFAYRHDILKTLINHPLRLVVLGPSERLADLPELKSLAQSEKIDLLSRSLPYSPGLGILVVDQQNILANPTHPLAGANQVVRVMAAAAYHLTSQRPVDLNWENRGRAVQQYELRVQRLDTRFDESLRKLFDDAKSAGRWKGSAAMHDRVQYWIAGVLAYFDAQGQTHAPTDAPRPISNREALIEYDRPLFDLVHTTFAYEGKPPWRLSRR